MPNERVSSTPVPVSVLVPCKNEAANLRSCLDAIAGWAGEIIILDSRSRRRAV
jgi:glycosyltransferase involved in cell wall biosynthesis